MWKAKNLRIGMEVTHYREHKGLGFIIDNQCDQGDEVVKVRWYYTENEYKEAYENANDLTF